MADRGREHFMDIFHTMKGSLKTISKDKGEGNSAPIGPQKAVYTV